MYRSSPPQPSLSAGCCTMMHAFSHQSATLARLQNAYLAYSAMDASPTPCNRLGQIAQDSSTRHYEMLAAHNCVNQRRKYTTSCLEKMLRNMPQQPAIQ